MSSTVIITVLTLFVLASGSAIILYFISQKFAVFEDPRIDQVMEVLPGANCGGCGFAGCRNFAESMVVAESLDGLNCPAGGPDVMTNIASILGKEVSETMPLTAVLKCNGTPEHRKKTSIYEGVRMCRIQHDLYSGDTDCSYGCIGMGDCVVACKFDALAMDTVTNLPVVDEDNCVACGACVRECPRNLLELHKKAPKYRKIYVACSNCDKGGPAKRACAVACIGCGKCVKVCKYEAITMENNLAYIDSAKCKLCRKCVEECPTNAIIEIGFPPRKPKVEVGNETVTEN
jgi:Na+-translocating ferredoxin:NAD+ oxidoreductase RNF subunit RnfB